MNKHISIFGVVTVFFCINSAGVGCTVDVPGVNSLDAPRVVSEKSPAPGDLCELRCDDGNPCTDDICYDGIQCSHVAWFDGGSCAMAPGGDENGVCHGGTCCDAVVEGECVVCDDGNECTKDAYVQDHGCESWNYTNLTTCGPAGTGHCNGNATPAECCNGCMRWLDKAIVCEAGCPGGHVCGSNGFCPGG